MLGQSHSTILWHDTYGGKLSICILESDREFGLLQLARLLGSCSSHILNLFGKQMCENVGLNWRVLACSGKEMKTCEP